MYRMPGIQCDILMSEMVIRSLISVISSATVTLSAFLFRNASYISQRFRKGRCHIFHNESICQEGGFYCPDSASSLYYKGSASLNGTIKLSVCA